MIRVPEFIGERDRQEALHTLEKRGKGPLMKQVKIEKLAEGQCVQVLRVGLPV